MAVSTAMVRALAGALEHAGVSRQSFLREAGVGESLLLDRTAWLALDDYKRVVAAARMISGDPAFGLHMGERVRPVMFDVVGPLVEHAGSLREMLELTVRYSRVLAVGHDPELHERGDVAWLRFPSLRGDDAFVQVTAEFAVTALQSMLELFVRDGARPSRVTFAYRAPEHVSEYRRVFGGTERFERAFTQVEFPRAWLDKEHPYRNPEVYGSLKAQADRTLGRLERDQSLRVAIEGILVKRGGEVTLEDVARALQVSVRSLHRRMRDEGVRYGEIVTQFRTNEAKRLLERPGGSIQETAGALGFRSVAAFHRAFKRWTGMTPKQYRNSF